MQNAVEPQKRGRGRPRKNQASAGTNRPVVSSSDLPFDLNKAQNALDWQTIQQPVQEKRGPGRPRKDGSLPASTTPRGKKAIFDMLRAGILHEGHKLFFSVNGFVFVGTLDKNGVIHDPVLGSGYSTPSAWLSDAVSRVGRSEGRRTTDISRIDMFHRGTRTNLKALMDMHSNVLIADEQKRCQPQQDMQCACEEMQRITYIPKPESNVLSATELSQLAQGKAVLLYEDYQREVAQYKTQIAMLQRDLQTANENLRGYETFHNFDFDDDDDAPEFPPLPPQSADELAVPPPNDTSFAIGMSTRNQDMNLGMSFNVQTSDLNFINQGHQDDITRVMRRIVEQAKTYNSNA